jgi:outer membrane protein OmpA-like peptidoglycan-associated protein
MKPWVVADVGLKNYQVFVEQNGNLLREYNGTADLPDSLLWYVEKEPLPTSEDPVITKFVAIDNEGQKAVTADTMNINQKTIRKKRVELKNATIIQRYSLILFDYDKATLTPHQIKVLDDIKKEIKPNSIVHIAAYTDRTGEPDYNKELARRRGEETKKRLFVPGVK